MKELIGHDKGPGIATGVVLLTLIDTLVQKGALAQADKARIFAIADAEMAGWGESNTAVQDARAVIAKMRGLGS